MARAKRTDRAEARRRYRAAMAGTVARAERTDRAEARRRRHPRPSDGRDSAATTRLTPSPPPAPTMRRSRDAFRRGDPPGSTSGHRHRVPAAFRRWLAATYRRCRLLASRVLGPIDPVGPSVALIAAGRHERADLDLLPVLRPAPAARRVFIAGFLAPRASWLLGALVGLAVGFQCHRVSARSIGGFLDAFIDPATRQPMATYGRRDSRSSARRCSSAVPIGALFAAGGGLVPAVPAERANPNRGRQAAAGASGRTARSRRSGPAPAPGGTRGHRRRA